MLTSKQRAALRAMAATMQPIFQIGKNGIGDETIRQIDAALEARELIKLHILETANCTAREACETLCAATGADGVQVIGAKCVLYRRSEKHPRIELPL